MSDNIHEVEPEQVVEPEPEPTLSQAEQDTKDKILFLLGVYPYQSRSMLQVALGPALPPSLWDPILQSLVQEGGVTRRDFEVVNHRQQSQPKTVYHLPTYPWPPVTIEQSNTQQAQANDQAQEEAA